MDRKTLIRRGMGSVDGCILSRQHMTYNHIDHLEGRRVLSDSEKDDLLQCMKKDVEQPTKAVLFAAKVLPLLSSFVFLAGVLLGLRDRLMIMLIILVSCSMFFGVMVYIIKDVRSFDDWNQYQKILRCESAYKVPVMVIQVWKNTNRLGQSFCCAVIQYKEQEAFGDACRLSGELYQELEEIDDWGELQIFAYYFENSRKETRQRGRYHVVIAS